MSFCTQFVHRSIKKTRRLVARNGRRSPCAIAPTLWLRTGDALNPSHGATRVRKLIPCAKRWETVVAVTMPHKFRSVLEFGGALGAAEETALTQSNRGAEAYGHTAAPTVPSAPRWPADNQQVAP